LIRWTSAHTIDKSFSSDLYRRGIDSNLFISLKQKSRIDGQVDDAFVVLKENLTIRIKIESILSEILKKTVILREEGGFLVANILKGTNVEYTFKDQESHGIKMFIMMLTLLYGDNAKFFIIDEPELYLHPQFQIFLLQGIRKIVGDPPIDTNKKCFFLSTHSPYFIDIRTINDLKNCIIFQLDNVPTWIQTLTNDDEFKLSQVLPQINTHHKQLFFSSEPIFVEGYRDQKIFSLIQERRGRLIGSSGSTFIDVYGKDVLDLFYRLCKRLSIQCKIIVDLDALIKGKLRTSVSYDERCMHYLQDHGISTNFLQGWSEVTQKIDSCVKELLRLDNDDCRSDEVKQLKNGLSKSPGDLDNQRYLFTLGVLIIKERLLSTLCSRKYEIGFIYGRVNIIIDAFKMANVYILPRGELENYFPINDQFNISDASKSSSFATEIEFLQRNDLSEADLTQRYGSVLQLLDAVTGSLKVDFKPSLEKHIMDFIYEIQRIVRFKNVQDLFSLKERIKPNLEVYRDIIDIEAFNVDGNSYKCRLRTKKFENVESRTIEFDDTFSPVRFKSSNI